MSCRYMEAPVWASAVFGTGLGYTLSAQVTSVPDNHEMQAEHANDLRAAQQMRFEDIR